MTNLSRFFDAASATGMIAWLPRRTPSFVGGPCLVTGIQAGKVMLELGKILPDMQLEAPALLRHDTEAAASPQNADPKDG